MMANPVASRPWSKVESAVTACCKGGPRTGLRYLRIDAKRVVCLRWHSQENGTKRRPRISKAKAEWERLVLLVSAGAGGGWRSQLKMSIAIS